MSNTTNMTPTEYANYIGEEYNKTISKEHKKRNAQYFSPLPIAKYMASMISKSTQNHVRVLDPGAGTGVLSCALCEKLYSLGAQSVELDLYEVDETVLPHLENSMEYLRRYLIDKGTDIKVNVINEDFILDNAVALNNFEYRYDYVISNPPFFKINRKDPRVEIMASVVHGQPNIYALFMMMSAFLLKVGGQLVYITPRSYTAGPYFRLFRERFFSMMRPEQIHVFNSRKEAFSRDSVLQENIILSATKNLDEWSIDREVIVSISNGTVDLISPRKRKVSLKQVIDFNTDNRVIFIPTSSEDDETVKIVQSWTGSLSDFGLKISTGPVVPFRAKECLDFDGDIVSTHAPLIWMNHIRPMSLCWPLPFDEIKKPQYLKLTEAKANKIVLVNKNYVLIRRMSSKEDKRRLTAAPFFKGEYNNQKIALENHTNYIHRPDGFLSREEVVGLAAVYNSKLLDNYFRVFNGNTQVSATEIQSLPLPDIKFIQAIGTQLINDPNLITEVDSWLFSYHRKGEYPWIKSLKHKTS